jgi:hypothetical protein
MPKMNSLEDFVAKQVPSVTTEGPLKVKHVPEGLKEWRTWLEYAD